MQKNKPARQKWLKKLLRIHFLVVTISLGVYFFMVFLDPGLLSYDLRQKFRALASDVIVVAATVLGAPVQPVVTAVSNCDHTTGTLTVALDWADDVNTYTYSIARDASPLVSGLASSAYSDSVVTAATTYSYIVTAHGPMGPGFADSVPVSVTTNADCVVTASAPTVAIISFDNRNISSYGSMPEVEERRPIITGTTSMPNAVMQVILVSDSDSANVIANFSANNNGYWQWQPPYGLTLGNHTLIITATDPLDNSRTANTSFSFTTVKHGDGGGGKSHKKALDGGVIVFLTPEVPIAPVDFSLEVTNSEKKVLQGNDLVVVLTVKQVAARLVNVIVPIRYSIFDETRGFVTSVTREMTLRQGERREESLAIPLYMATGKYFVTAEILTDGAAVSREDNFTVAALPLIQLGSGAVFTYADLVSNLGWIIFLSLLFCLVWTFLLIREFSLYLQGDRTITEWQLKKAGYFSKGKGGAV